MSLCSNCAKCIFNRKRRSNIAVTISYLSNAQQDEALVGLTAKQAKEQYQQAWNIPAETLFMVNGKQVDEIYQLKDGDMIEFHINML